MTSIQIRQATPADFDAICSIYAAARQYMASTGNATQWGTNKPTPETIRQDFADKTNFVGVDEDGVAQFVFALFKTPDPTYEVIYDGAWLNDEPYITLHRVASSGVVPGVFSRVLAFAKEKAVEAGIKNIRIDTHNNNLTMQHVILKNGFVHCGTIIIDDGTPRLAYQLTL